MQQPQTLMKIFNSTLLRHPSIEIPAHCYEILLAEGFTLLLDGPGRRILEVEHAPEGESNVDCTIETSFAHLQILLSTPSKAIGMVLKKQLIVSNNKLAMELAVALKKVMAAEEVHASAWLS